MVYHKISKQMIKPMQIGALMHQFQLTRNFENLH